MECHQFYFILLILACSRQLQCDDGQYIIYCPCMGRFGNQAEQLLGSLQFAKLLNRTVVLPPFINHVGRQTTFIPFSDVLDVDVINKYTSAITSDKFMKDVAPSLWPSEERRIFCYSERPGSKEGGCNALDGNPFGPFWRHIGVTEFVQSVFYKPLTTRADEAGDWIHDYGQYPVLAFVGAPSAFPVDDKTTELHKYLQLSSKLKDDGHSYMNQRGLKHPYIAVHWRHGSDWTKACDLLKENDMKQLFSSSQCFPGTYRLPYNLCFQDTQAVARDVFEITKTSSISTVYVATDRVDDDDFLELYNLLVKNLPQVVLLTPTRTFSPESPTGIKKEVPPTFLQDLIIMTESDHFLGNCISSFTAFVSRSRKWNMNEAPTTFLSNEIKHRLDDEL